MAFVARGAYEQGVTTASDIAGVVIDFNVARQQLKLFRTNAYVRGVTALSEIAGLVALE